MFYNYKNKSDGKSYRCKICDDKARKKWVATNPEQAHKSSRNNNLKIRFGVDIEWYEEQFKKQGSCCALCGIAENQIQGTIKNYSFSVDHDHITGKIRGILCNPCNRALGFFKDNAAVLRKAADYVERV